jgi:hypothetical protein
LVIRHTWRVRFALRRACGLPKVVLTQPTEDHMTKLKLTAVSILVTLVAACESAPLPEAHAQQPEATRVSYPDPAEGSGDGQVFEY